MTITFYLYAVALGGGKFNAEKQVFNNKEKALEFALEKIYNDNAESASIVYCDNLHTNTIATIDKTSTVADYFNIMGKLPGGHIYKAA